MANGPWLDYLIESLFEQPLSLRHWRITSTKQNCKNCCDGDEALDPISNHGNYWPGKVTDSNHGNYGPGRVTDQVSWSKKSKGWSNLMNHLSSAKPFERQHHTINKIDLGHLGVVDCLFKIIIGVGGSATVENLCNSQTNLLWVKLWRVLSQSSWSSADWVAYDQSNDLFWILQSNLAKRARRWAVAMFSPYWDWQLPG